MIYDTLGYARIVNVKVTMFAMSHKDSRRIGAIQWFDPCGIGFRMRDPPSSLGPQNFLNLQISCPLGRKQSAMGSCSQGAFAGHVSPGCNEKV
jgi:hypothetical protein